MSIILNAARLADKYHAKQVRDDSGLPYKTHLIRVAGRVSMLPGMEEHHVAGAWLHDSIEDQSHNFGNSAYMQEEIGRECCMDTVAVVIALTNPSKKFPSMLRAERKALDREHISRLEPRIKQIKLVDRIDNLTEMTHDLRHGIATRFKFGLLYADESELLLNKALLGTDPLLEAELVKVIADLREVCRTSTVVT